MSMFWCAICDECRDSDFIDCEELNGELVCLECVPEADELEPAPPAPTIRGIPISQLPPEVVADRTYQDGEGQDANPYTIGSTERERFALRMGYHHQQELKSLQQQDRSGI
jgi:hypothetical protein